MSHEPEDRLSIGAIVVGLAAAVLAIVAFAIIGGFGGLAAALLLDADRGRWTLVGIGGGMIGGCVIAGAGVLALVGRYVGHRHELGDAVTAEPASVTLSYAIQQPEQIRIVPYVGNTTRLIDNVPEQDLCAFIDGVCTKGHTQSKWIGFRMPSGRVVDIAYWTALSLPLRKAGIIQGVAQRKAGYLTMTDPEEIKWHLGLVDLLRAS
jgi:hypothetical protein